MIRDENENVLFQSWIHQTREEEREACLPNTNTLIYNIYYVKGYISSSFEIRGIYDNVVTKTVICIDDCQFSLLTPVKKGDTWKWTTNTEASWNLNHQEQWQDTISGNYPKTDQTHYFTIPFEGKSEMAAYEMKFYYRSGIVAYINGVEVYRDNLPSGIITNATIPIHSYTSYDYRGSIRNGVEVSSSRCVLAVEIHLTGSESIQFDGWLAIYKRSDVIDSEDNCYSIQSITTRANDGYNCASVSDFDASSCITWENFKPGISYVEYVYTTAQVNSFRTLLDISDAYFYQFDLTVKDILTEQFLDQKRITVTPSVTNYYFLNFGNAQSPNSNTARVYVMMAKGEPTWMCEIIPRVCATNYNMSLTYPKFDREEYEFDYGDEIYIQPENRDQFITCSIIPPLPTGLQLSKCSIIGRAITELGKTTFTMYAYDHLGTKIVTFQLKMNPIPSENELYGWIIRFGIGIGIAVIIMITIVYINFFNRKKQLKQLRKQNAEVIVEGKQYTTKEVVSQEDGNEENIENLSTKGEQEIEMKSGINHEITETPSTSSSDIQKGYNSNQFSIPEIITIPTLTPVSSNTIPSIDQIPSLPTDNLSPILPPPILENAVQSDPNTTKKNSFPPIMEHFTSTPTQTQLISVLPPITPFQQQRQENQGEEQKDNPNSISNNLPPIHTNTQTAKTSPIINPESKQDTVSILVTTTTGTNTKTEQSNPVNIQQDNKKTESKESIEERTRPISPPSNPTMPSQEGRAMKRPILPPPPSNHTVLSQEGRAMKKPILPPPPSNLTKSTPYGKTMKTPLPIPPSLKTQ